MHFSTPASDCHKWDQVQVATIFTIVEQLNKFFVGKGVARPP